jgi:hypothetical protein
MPSRRHKTLASASPIRYYDLSLSVFVKGFRDVGPGRRAEYCLLPLLPYGIGRIRQMGEVKLVWLQRGWGLVNVFSL